MPSPARLLKDRRATPRPPPGGLLSSEADLAWHAALRRHWPEYLIEALFLAVFLVAAGGLAAAFDHPGGALRAIVPGAFMRQLLTGVVLGLVVTAMIYSPWGRRSGTHLNPAITLAFFRLRKVGRWDLLFYVLAQVAGGLAGVLVLRAGLNGVLGAPMAVAPPVPGGHLVHQIAAFAAEFVLSAAIMLVILFTTNHATWYRWTGAIYGLLIAIGVTIVPPLSGFGLNPARLFATNLTGAVPVDGWLYVLPPFLGMQLAVDAYRALTGRTQVVCAKLAHNVEGRCIFRCQHPDQARALARAAVRRHTPGERC